MRPKVVVLMTSLAFAAIPAARVDARPMILGKAEAKKAKEAPPPTVDKKVKLSPDGLKFGMTLEEISKLYEKVLDAEFVPLYQTVEPGPRMSELDTELADKKLLVMRNKVEFGALPSGLEALTEHFIKILFNLRVIHLFCLRSYWSGPLYLASVSPLKRPACA